MFAEVMSSSVKTLRAADGADLNHLMTGAQLPLYVILHVITMTSFSCTAPDDDRLVVHVALPSTINNTRIYMPVEDLSTATNCTKGL